MCILHVWYVVRLVRSTLYYPLSFHLYASSLSLWANFSLVNGCTSNPSWQHFKWAISPAGKTTKTVLGLIKLRQQQQDVVCEVMTARDSNTANLHRTFKFNVLAKFFEMMACDWRWVVWRNMFCRKGCMVAIVATSGNCDLYIKTIKMCVCGWVGGCGGGGERESQMNCQNPGFFFCKRLPLTSPVLHLFLPRAVSTKTLLYCFHLVLNTI